MRTLSKAAMPLSIVQQAFPASSNETLAEAGDATKTFSRLLRPGIAAVKGTRLLDD
jgi:hypothetical protein